jgi:hypothetical protein
MFPVRGWTIAPDRAQIAESLEAHEDGAINTWRLLQSEFQTWTIRPFAAEIAATWPW